MRILLLLALVGLSACFQPGVQYKYSYKGKVLSSHPDINASQRSVIEFNADLNVRVTQEKKIIFKLENPRTNSSVDGQRTTPEPIPATLLGQYEFGVGPSGDFFFPSNAPTGVVNYYKAIVSNLYIAPVRESLHQSNGFSGVSNYRLNETTNLGECESSYTIHKLRGSTSVMSEEYVERTLGDDCQRTKQQCPILNNTVWESIRTIDLGKCSDPVSVEVLWRANSSEMNCLSKSQCGNLISRNSISVYSLRGNSQGMRIERARVEGKVILATIGLNSEHMASITEQVFKLRTVKENRNPPPIQSSTIRTRSLLNTVVSPSMQSSSRQWLQPGTPKSMASFLTGTEITSSQVQIIIREVERVIEEAASATPPKDVAQQLELAAELLFSLDENTLNSIAEKFSGVKRALYFDLLASTGSKPAIDVIMNHGKEVSEFRSVLVMGQLATTLKSAEALKKLLDTTLALDINAYPFMSTNVIINMARLTSRVCVRPRPQSAVHEVFHTECRHQRVVEKLESFITKHLETTNEFWMRMSMLKALNVLQTDSSFRTQLPYVLGQKDVNEMVRAFAIRSFEVSKVPQKYRREVTDILFDIVENPAETSYIRTTALRSIVTRHLEAYDWNRLAFITRRPGPKYLKALVYNIVEETSQFTHADLITQARLARHALVVARKVPLADKYSQYRMFFNTYLKKDVSVYDYVGIMEDPVSRIPSAIDILHERTQGGFTMQQRFEASIANDNGNLVDIAMELISGTPRVSAHRLTETDYINKIKGDLGITDKQREAITGFLKYTPLSQMSIFVPIQHSYVVDFLSAIGVDFKTKTFTAPGPVYYNAIKINLVVPNDMGLPVLVYSAYPKFYKAEGQIKAYRGSPNEIRIRGEDFTFEYNRNSLVRLTTFVPFVGVCIGAGYSHDIHFDIPANPTVTIYSQEERDFAHPFVEVSVSSKRGREVTLYEQVSKPFIYARVMNKDLTFEDLMYGQVIVRTSKGPQPRDQFTVSGTIGEHFRYLSEGDSRLGWNKESFARIIANKGEWGSILMKNIFSPLTSKYYHRKISDDVFAGNAEVTLTLQLTKGTLKEKEGCSNNFVNKNVWAKRGQQPPRHECTTEGTASCFANYLRDSRGWCKPTSLTSARLSVRELTRSGSVKERTVVGVVANSKAYPARHRFNDLTMYTVVTKNNPNNYLFVENNQNKPFLSELDCMHSLREKNLSTISHWSVFAGQELKPLVYTTNTKYYTGEYIKNVLESVMEETGPRATPHDHLARFFEKFQYSVIREDTQYADVKLWEKYPTAHIASMIHYYTNVLPVGYTVVFPQQTCSDKCQYYSFFNRTGTHEWEVTQQYENWPKIQNEFVRTNDYLERNTYLHEEYLFTQDEACVVTPEQISTFDNLKTNVTLNTCPLLLSVTREAREPNPFIVTASKNNNGDLRVDVQVASENLRVQLEVDQIKVNENQVELYHSLKSQKSGREIGGIFNDNKGVMLFLYEYGKVYIRENTIFLKVDKRYNGFVTGACGSKDWEYENELITPGECQLDDPEKYTEVWSLDTAPGCSRHNHGSSCNPIQGKNIRYHPFVLY